MDLYAAQSGRIEENKKCGNVENGWFSGHCVMQFNLKDIIKMGEQQIDFYQAIYNEIEIAFKNWKVKTTSHLCPSALMPPWQSGMLSSLLSTIAQADAYVSSENELFLLDRIAVDDGSDGIAVLSGLLEGMQ